MYIDSDGNETRPGKVRALRGRRNPIKKNKSRRGGLNNIPGPLDADNNGSGEKRDALCAKNAPPATGGSDLKAPRDDETPESNAIDLISKMKPISGPPVKDSVIGFRILQISENYTPEVSDLKVRDLGYSNIYSWDLK